jgi:uncharacterized protein (TIGR03067 family)
MYYGVPWYRSAWRSDYRPAGDAAHRSTTVGFRVVCETGPAAVDPDRRAAVRLGQFGGADLAQEMQKLNGLWKFVRGELNGKELTGQLAEGRQILLTDGSYVQKFGRNTIEGTYRIDPTKRPKTIDFTPMKGGRAEARGKQQLGIYELDGDTFKYCVTYSGNPRPTEFTTDKPNGGQALQAYVREKEEPKPQ